MKSFTKNALFTFSLAILAFATGFALCYKFASHHPLMPSYSDSEITRILNTKPSSFAGKAYCLSKSEALKHGGRLCYYVNNFSRPGAGALLLPYAVQKKNAASNDVKDILVAIAIRHNGNAALIGGFINPLDLAPIGSSDERVNHMEGNIFSQYVKQKPLLTPQEYYTPDFYSEDEHKDQFTIPAKNSFDRSFIDAVLRETKEESGWNLSKKDLISVRGAYFFENEVHWTQITALFPAYVGELSMEGNMEDETRNILIKDYKSKGFDDIKEVRFISLKSLEIIDNKLVLGPLKFTMNDYKTEQLNYVMLDAISHIIKKQYGLDINTKQNTQAVAKFIKEPLNGNNIKNLIDTLNLASKN